MAIAWPSGVPTEATTDTNGGPQKSRLEFQPDIGPAISRQRTTLTMSVFSVVFQPWTQAQLASFEAWYLDTAGSGSLEFLLNDFFTGNEAVWRFVETYQVSQQAPDHFTVSTQLLRVRFT